MTTENDGELQSAAEIAAARQQFLSEPPPIVDSNEPAVTDPAADDAAAEAAALEELTTPATPSEGAPAPAPVTPPAAADPFAPFGGEEAVRNAHQVQEALRTEQGVRALVANGLTALGYTPEQIRAALAGEAQAPTPTAPAEADPLAGLDDDDVLTVAGAKAIIEQAVTKATQAATTAATAGLAPVQEAVAAQQATAVRNNTDAAVISVLGPVPTDANELQAYRTQVDAIVARASQNYDPAQWANPSHISQIVTQAHAELEAEADARFKAYLERKKTVRDSTPVNTAGGAGSEGPLPEPKNLAEAREQARAAGFFS
jgi:hypothetical protein